MTDHRKKGKLLILSSYRVLWKYRYVGQKTKKQKIMIIIIKSSFENSTSPSTWSPSNEFFFFDLSTDQLGQTIKNKFNTWNNYSIRRKRVTLFLFLFFLEENKLSINQDQTDGYIS
jgi:hypothetical protein